MIIIEVYSPSVDTSYDFQVDDKITGADAAMYFCDMIAKKNGSDVKALRDVSLYDTAGQRELDPAMSLRENGITSGMKLLLV